MSIYGGIPYCASEKYFDAIYDCSDNATMFLWKNASEEMMSSYIAQLEERGFTKHQELDNPCVHSATYYKEQLGVHAYYLKKRAQLRVIIQKDAVLPVNNYEYEKLCDVAVTQTGLYNDPNVYTSMGYLIRLEDGTFVVIDGGKDVDSHAELLYNTMLEQKPDGVDSIVISAWILTHGHSDHYGVLRNFLRNYNDKVTVKMLIGNDISDVTYQGCAWGRNFNYNVVSERFEGCCYMKAHTGQQFRFPGVTMTVLYTHEDYFPDMMRNYNDTSIVVDAVIQGEITEKPIKKGETRFVFLADIHPDGAQRLINAYGAYMRCDIMQISHHGIGPSLYDLYAMCNPRIAYWPCGRAVLEYKDGARLQRPHLKYLLETTDQIIYRTDESHTFFFDSKDKKENT
jgi:beta-lactamase superfamily II metal-dependent hydrolase